MHSEGKNLFDKGTIRKEKKPYCDTFLNSKYDYPLRFYMTVPETASEKSLFPVSAIWPCRLISSTNIYNLIDFKSWKLEMPIILFGLFPLTV